MIKRNNNIINIIYYIYNCIFIYDIYCYLFIIYYYLLYKNIYRICDFYKVIIINIYIYN